ncbi:MAG: hypothetical protein U0Q55_05150 [Vicinamibacterales bacterium]
MVPWFIATERFSPDSGDAWTTFVDWSGLTHLTEVVSLDPMLCPTLLPDVQPGYWPHIVNEDFALGFFTDLAFLRGEIAGFDDLNLLCVYRNPEREPSPPGGFELLGYDLMDVQGSASALTNCGGFPDVFEPSELTPLGLLPWLPRARAVQDALRQRYPDEPQADCHVWAICRATDGGAG